MCALSSDMENGNIFVFSQVPLSQDKNLANNREWDSEGINTFDKSISYQQPEINTSPNSHFCFVPVFKVWLIIPCFNSKLHFKEDFSVYLQNTFPINKKIPIFLFLPLYIFKCFSKLSYFLSISGCAT